MNLNTVRRLTLEYRSDGAEKVTGGLREHGKVTDDVTAKIERQAKASEQIRAAYDRLARQQAMNLQQERQFADAMRSSEMAAQARTAANDNVARSFLDVGSEALKTAGHLKLAAVAAYALSPAFRAMVNPAITGALAAMGPAAVSAGGAIMAAMAPAFAFMSKIAVPILVIVAAWKALNSVVDLGQSLLEKYGNAQRSLVAGVDDNLKKLTRFQDEGLSAEQVQRATELGARMTEAKRTISEFFRVQFGLVDPALQLQAVWVRIVELVAAAVDKLNRVPSWAIAMMAGAATGAAIGSVVPVIGTGVGAVAGAAAGLAANLTSSSEAETQAVSRADALTAAHQRLAAGMGSTSNFAVRFGNAINDLQNLIKATANETKTAAGEFDRLEHSLNRSAAAQEAEARAVGASVGEHARLRAEFRLQEAARQDISKAFPKLDDAGVNQKLEDYAERIKKVSDRIGVATQKAAELRLASDIKFTGDTLFLSDTEKQIASILRQTYGPEWKNMMDGPEAGAMRLNAQMKQLGDVAANAFSGFTKDIAAGMQPLEAFNNQLKNISSTLLDMVSKDLMRQALGGLTGKDTGSGLGSMIGGLLGVSTGMGALLGLGATPIVGVASSLFPKKAKPQQNNDNEKTKEPDRDCDQYRRAA